VRRCKFALEEEVMIEERQEVGKPKVAPAPGSSPKVSRRAAREPRADVTLTSLTLIGEDRRRMIAEAAYFRAEQRGFVPGSELEDWLAAELEVDALLGEDEVR
jgi:Protein of unknown function (DUF2934)